MRRLILLTVLSLSAIAALAAAPALANGSAVLGDCNSNGALTRHYSRADLQNALNTMPADIKEYTNCYDVISRALLASAGGGHTGGGSSSGSQGSGSPSGGSGHSGSGSNGAQTPSAAKHGHPRAGTTSAAAGSNAPISPATGSTTPTASGVNTASSGSSLPTVLIVVLILLGLAALSGGGVAIRRRVVARDGA
jgi:hypothetical protein